MANWWEEEYDPDGKKPVWDAVLSAYADVTTERSGWLRSACPMCEEVSGPDKKLSLGLNTKTGGYCCLKCGERGRLPSSYRDQLSDLLDADLDLDMPRDIDTTFVTKERTEVEVATGFVKLFEGQGLEDPRYDAVRSYVLSPKSTLVGEGKPCRNIPFDRAREIGIGTGIGKLSGRIVFPILDWENPEGPWLAWFGRDATGLNQIPHLYSRGLARYSTVWNATALFVETDVPVFVMEGCLDAQAVWPHGVACLGKPLPAHNNLFLRARRPIVVCLDGDAWREGQALAWSLALRGCVTANLRLPPKVDPDEVPREWLFSEAARLLGRTT